VNLCELNGHIMMCAVITATPTARFIKMQIGLTHPVPAYPSSPRKKAVKQVSVCLSVYQQSQFFNSADTWHGMETEQVTPLRRTLASSP